MFRYDIDRLRFDKFKLDLEQTMEDRQDECAPAYELIWADELSKQICHSWTPKAIKQIAKNLVTYIEGIEKIW